MTDFKNGRNDATNRRTGASSLQNYQQIDNL